ncbi:hypothetical protein SARC_01924 [Sphaeroforma arctica JP610]|uniref:RRM domain-containing protein n=1 Tax=Sphaeroforma arctica JP610 TaxID=667725 RepID=A0A0L0GAH1_9EUKA|nr:hypothetical protein SARC_01924 [Sphaeroforma arctica JP610]KNC85886.1 hypothetical protein SARC_01924 [Sphaeroforma arctica JP610]|eukprot:XP_014159788.1 hypothetical protein SARC_01924 [Sphaeroforma arctica JP610]
MELNGKTLNVELARIRESQPPKTAKKSSEDKPKRSGERKRDNRTRMSKEEREEKRQTLPDSETLVFVANLPFSYEDEELSKAFEGFSVTSAKVSKRYNGKSRGFGLVEFETHEMQQKAIQTVSELDGREIIIRVAKIEQEKQPRASTGTSNNSKPAASGAEDELHDTDDTEVKPE